MGTLSTSCTLYMILWLIEIVTLLPTPDALIGYWDYLVPLQVLRYNTGSAIRAFFTKASSEVWLHQKSQWSHTSCWWPQWHCLRPQWHRLRLQSEWCLLLFFGWWWPPALPYYLAASSAFFWNLLCWSGTRATKCGGYVGANCGVYLFPSLSMLKASVS